jgi:hypothetical protein
MQRRARLPFKPGRTQCYLEKAPSDSNYCSHMLFFGGGSLCSGLPAAERPLSCHLRATDVVANRFVTDGQSVYVYVFQRRYSADSTAKFFLGLENRSAEKVSFSFLCVCSVISLHVRMRFRSLIRLLTLSDRSHARCSSVSFIGGRR